MKTVYTTLPIYDKIEKQTYQRSKDKGMDKPVPIICSTSELPSFQWIDGGDGCTSVTSVEVIDFNGNVSALALTVTLVTLTSNSYFVYAGGAVSLSCGLQYLKITMDNAKVYYSEWFDAKTVTDCIMIEFSNVCDLGNILYQTAFVQKTWIKSEPMEETFPLEEEGVKNGEGMFVRSFARQPKKYLVITNTLPSYMVDVFNRMRLHDTVLLTDLVGDTNEVFNLEVEHEYLENTSNYYAKISLTFDYDETFIVSGCCNNLI
jgi:hypothetical protein